MSACLINCLDEGFQSTPPARGATEYGKGYEVVGLISIHAPREGGDVVRLFDKLS